MCIYVYIHAFLAALYLFMIIFHNVYLHHVYDTLTEFRGSAYLKLFQTIVWTP